MLIQRSQVLPTLAIYVMLNQIPHVLPTLSNHIKALNFWVLMLIWRSQVLSTLVGHVALIQRSHVLRTLGICVNGEISSFVNTGYSC